MGGQYTTLRRAAELTEAVHRPCSACPADPAAECVRRRGLFEAAVRMIEAVNGSIPLNACGGCGEKLDGTEPVRTCYGGPVSTWHERCAAADERGDRIPHRTDHDIDQLLRHGDASGDLTRTSGPDPDDSRLAGVEQEFEPDRTAALDLLARLNDLRDRTGGWPGGDVVPLLEEWFASLGIDTGSDYPADCPVSDPDCEGGQTHDGCYPDGVQPDTADCETACATTCAGPCQGREPTVSDVQRALRAIGMRLHIEVTPAAPE